MKLLRTGVYTVMALAVLTATAGMYFAIARGSDTQQRYATLVVAVMALVITVVKVVIDAFVAPEDRKHSDESCGT